MLCSVLLLVSLLVMGQLDAVGADDIKAAIVITLAGDAKLSEYFEWSCRSMANVGSVFEMIVFHENNAKVKQLRCPSNVKIIDLGPKGMSKIISYRVMEVSESEVEKYKELHEAVADVLLHVPRLLIEIKPMMGHIFAEHLAGYTHWTYSDPDIIWGNLDKWLTVEDMQHFDVITLAKTLDAGRLFIRGQFALHKNTKQVNQVYKALSYLSQQEFAQNVGNARGMLGVKLADEIYARCFHSSEGWYSSAIFKSGVSVKVLSRGFNDFSMDPVIMYNKQLVRCPLSDSITLSGCIRRLTALTDAFEWPEVRELGGNLRSIDEDAGLVLWLDGYNRDESQLPPLMPSDVQAEYSKSLCMMQWLPVALRYCIISPKTKKLEKVGEAFMDRHSALKPAQWQINDEHVSRRQLHYVSPMFHFRHWDDYGSSGISTIWSADAQEAASVTGLPSCMVLRVDADKVMKFQTCDSVLAAPERDQKQKKHLRKGKKA